MMNAMFLTILILGQAQSRPAPGAILTQVRQNAVVTNRKLDKLVAAEKSAAARRKADSEARAEQTRRSVRETNRRVEVLEMKLQRLAKAKPRVVTVVRYVPVRTVTKVTPVRIAAKPAPKKTAYGNWLWGILTAPKRSHLAVLSNWD